MVTSDMDNVRQYVQEKMESLPRIEEKLESYNTKILYLVKRINNLSKVKGADDAEVTPDRLKRVVERLGHLGLMVEYSDGRGFVKLKAVDQKGLDTIKRMNTVFPISMIESFLDNVVVL
jgi:hypothetical protein